MNALIFIDTNIFLDFYRISGRKADLSILEHIDANHDRIITTSQVEMEFKKNRPTVIRDTHLGLKTPDWGSIAQLPAFLDRSKQSSGLVTGRKKIDSQLKTLRKRVANVLQAPTRYDNVYKVTQRLFRSNGPYNLSRERPERVRIRRLARKRFLLGFPPRKAKDTSIGDSVNWEWIVHCAKEGHADVVIVSRDSDFGISLDNKWYINDWLSQEFRERVGRKRKLTLTARLAEGLKLASIPVTKEEDVAEQEFLKSRPRYPDFLELNIHNLWSQVDFDVSRELQKRVTQQMAEAFEKPSIELQRAIKAAGRGLMGYPGIAVAPEETESDADDSDEDDET